MINYVEYGIDTSGAKIYARIDEDGLIRVTCAEENPEYQTWLKKQKEQLNGSIN